MSNLTGHLSTGFDWFLRLVYINLLWLGFTLLGLVLFGLGPATTSMFTVMKKWVTGQEDIKIFATFWQTYKKDFFRANLLVFCLLSAGSLLYVDFLFIGYFEGGVATALSGILLLFVIVFMIILIYVFPVFVSYKLKPVQYIQYAIHFGISSPLSIVIILLSILLMYYLILLIPATLPFLSVSVISFVIMRQTQGTITKIENKYTT